MYSSYRVRGQKSKLSYRHSELGAVKVKTKNYKCSGLTHCSVYHLCSQERERIKLNSSLFLSTSTVAILLSGKIDTKLIPFELFQILKDDIVQVLHSICQQIWTIQQGPQDWKRSVFVPVPKKGNTKECSNNRTIALISHASKVMLKILQARLQQYVNCELPDVQAGFRKSRGTRDQLPTSTGSWKKQESSRKTSALLTTPKPLTVDHNKLWKILQEMGYQTTWPASWEICMRVKKLQLELDMEQQTGSK